MLKKRLIIFDNYGVKKTFSCTVGTPQGGVLSCLIWIICMDELIELLNKSPGIFAMAYSDDLVFSVTIKEREQ